MPNGIKISNLEIDWNRMDDILGQRTYTVTIDKSGEIYVFNCDVKLCKELDSWLLKDDTGIYSFVTKLADFSIDWTKAIWRRENDGR